MRTGATNEASLRTAPAVASPPGAINFRELGGVHGLGGAVRRRGVVFRSGSLEGFTPLGGSSSHTLGVCTIIDLRGPAQPASAPTHPHEGQEVDVEGLPMWQDPTRAAAFTEKVFEQLPPGTSAAEALKIYSDTNVAGYKTMVLRFPRVFRGVTSILARSRGRPALVHCAGNDRPGLVCAVVLAAIGVGVGVGVGEAEIRGLPALPWGSLVGADRTLPEEPAAFRNPGKRPPPRLRGPSPGPGRCVPRQISAIGGSVEGYLRRAGHVTAAELEHLRCTLLLSGPPQLGSRLSPLNPADNYPTVSSRTPRPHPPRVPN